MIEEFILDDRVCAISEEGADADKRKGQNHDDAANRHVNRRSALVAEHGRAVEGEHAGTKLERDDVQRWETRSLRRRAPASKGILEFEEQNHQHLDDERSDQKHDRADQPGRDAVADWERRDVVSQTRFAERRVLAGEGRSCREGLEEGVEGLDHGEADENDRARRLQRGAEVRLDVAEWGDDCGDRRRVGELSRNRGRIVVARFRQA